MKHILSVLILALVANAAVAQTPGPDVTSWIINTTGATGYQGIPSNVQLVRYSAENVYVSCTSIPGYGIGPWQGNPNIPVNQNFVFKITRTPQKNNGTPTPTSLGHIGVWSNGVSIFNAKDARTYNNANVWHQNAIVVEGPGFDACLGHPAPGGEYHHHLNPRCLYNDRDSSKHSPIIGYAFDGFPIYGAYGFKGVDGTGEITRMRSSYRLRAITERTTLANGTVLQAAQYGPAVTGQYTLGYYVEDFEYVDGLGDLDAHNGRFCITPDYPNGTYAYFVTIEADGTAAYPYTPGPDYYGVVPAGNTGPGSGHNTPSETVITWTTATVPDVAIPAWNVWPNPALSSLSVTPPAGVERWSVALSDALGREGLVVRDLVGSHAVTIPLDGVEAGTYLVTIRSGENMYVRKVTVVK